MKKILIALSITTAFIPTSIFTMESDKQKEKHEATSSPKEDEIERLFALFKVGLDKRVPYPQDCTLNLEFWMNLDTGYYRPYISIKNTPLPKDKPLPAPKIEDVD